MKLPLRTAANFEKDTTNSDNHHIFFDGVQELKNVTRSLENEFRQLIGDVQYVRREAP